VRLVKTSSQEKEIILDDCVHINKVKTFKPSNKVTQDDIITIRKRENTFVVRFSELADKRLGFKNAISLYERIL
jgi:ribosomal 50S subunit-recycling heat shock protein